METTLFTNPSESRISIVANVHNAGRDPVFIESVTLVRIEREFAHAVQLDGANTTEPLRPGEGREYSLETSNYYSEHLALCSKCGQNDVWVSICSPAGEVCRLRGDQVLPVLHIALADIVRNRLGNVKGDTAASEVTARE